MKNAPEHNTTLTQSEIFGSFHCLQESSEPRVRRAALLSLSHNSVLIWIFIKIYQRVVFRSFFLALLLFYSTLARSDAECVVEKSIFSKTCGVFLGEMWKSPGIFLLCFVLDIFPAHTPSSSSAPVHFSSFNGWVRMPPASMRFSLSLSRRFDRKSTFVFIKL